MEDGQNTSLMALSSLLRHQGSGISLARLQQDYVLGRTELSNDLIVRIATEQGFRARWIKRKRGNLDRLGEALPALARLANGRSVVLIGQMDKDGRRQVVVHDPMASGDGRVTVDHAVFTSVWSGELLLLRPNHATAASRPFGLRWFADEVLAQRGVLRDVVIAALSIQVLSLASPIFFQLVVDKVLIHDSRSTLIVLLIGVALALVLELLFRFLRDYVLLIGTNRIDIRLARQTFAKLLTLRLSFFEQRSAGVVTQHMQQAERVRQFLTGKLLFTLLDATTLVVFVPFLWFYSPTLTLVTLGFGTLIAATIGLLIGTYSHRLKALYLAEGERQALLVESIHGMRTVKSLAIEPLQQLAWERRSSAAVRMHYGVGAISAGAQALVYALQTMMGVAVIAVGAFAVFNHSMTLGALIAFQILSGRVIQPLVQMVTLLKDYQETALSIRMLGEVMNEPSETLGAGGQLRPDLDGTVSFERVSFRYPGRQVPAIADLTLTIPTDKVIGVVGRSGSGKTTLTRLIQGLYACEDGILRVGGYDIRELDLNHLRRCVAVVLQDNFLFHGTVRENIAVTMPSADLEQIVRAAHLAGADEFIQRLPRGYDTLLEENGANLSGGQKQRIAIARALLPEPPILIFDEATSALDPESEAIIQENLARIALGRTLIIVSHRLSTVCEADLIVVFDQGRIVSRGNHRELIQACGIYRSFWRQQNRIAA